MNKKNNSSTGTSSPLQSDKNILPTDGDSFTAPFIVAIGASAGGLETLKAFFTHSVANANIAFVIITHLSSDHISLLPELLQQYTPIKVLQITNQQKLEANHIYVLPPGKNVAIHHGILELVKKKSNSDKKLPIDYFLCSLAKDQGQKVICIILSGMGNDGTIGLRALREQGGLVIAQTTKSARYDSMPKSAINTGLVDYVLPPEEMYTFLTRYVAHVQDRTIEIEESMSDELERILTFLKNQTSHDFSLYKPNTIFRRIQKRIDILQIDQLSTYVYYLHQHPEEITILFKELLINVTSFFRDPEAFALLKQKLFEKIVLAHSYDKVIRVWIPGCSTGEEAYSIAILLQECMSTQKHPINVQIFATDIDEDAIELARAGVYPISITQDVSPERLERFFIKEGEMYKVNPDVRKMIIFAVQNIIKDPPFTKLDLLCCRNLLIYFKPQLQKKIFPLFHYSLKPDGLLFIGTSENLGGSHDFFKIIDKRLKIYARKSGKSTFHSAMSLSSMTELTDIADTKITGKNMPEVEPILSNLIKNILLKNYTPACVVIDDKGNIQHTYGPTSRFLEFADGEVRLQLIDMVCAELKSKLRIAIHKASEKKQDVLLSGLQFKENNEFKHVNIKISPISEAGAVKRELLLITFEDAPQVTQTPVNNDSSRGKEEAGKKLSQLEQELKYTKENLQTTIEELETSNEELKSSNEELQSTNEELQSTNEEIETSKEELQSLNEELTTVNVELESRIEQLSSTNDDIKNLLDNTEIATIFLDKNLCIKRFTPKATELINLISTDIGRPINHIVSNLHYDKLIEDARTVLKILEPIATESIDNNGHWYAIRIIPYRTVTNHVDGVVVTFVNIHAQKQAETKVSLLENDLNLLNNFDHTLLNTLPNPTVLLDKSAKVIIANQQFMKTFGIKNKEMVGHSIYKINDEWNKSELENVLEQLLQDESLVKTAKIEITPGKIVNAEAHMLSTSAILLSLN